jgi:pantetheine-phosphate adenylyltransferase
MSMLRIVGVAGTFGPLHQGHKLLLHQAFEVGEKVLIALTTELMLQHKIKKEKIPSYDERKQMLDIYLKAEGYQGRYEIIPLNDKFGVAVTLPAQEGIVTSEDTAGVAEEINTIRIQKGFNPLQIFIIKMVLAQDGTPISSTRIRNAEIDAEGHSIK